MINMKQLIITLLVIIFASTCAFAATIESATQLDNDDVRKEETTLGDLVADALRAYASVDIAFIAASDLKKVSPIPAGKVDTKLITDAIAYPDDTLTVLNLSGADIKNALNRSLSIYPQPNMSFLQVSGLTLRFDASTKQKDKVVSVAGNNAELEDGRTYSVVMPTSLANGALGYWRVWTKDQVDRIIPQSSTVHALETYLEKNTKINYSNLNRIVAANS